MSGQIMRALRFAKMVLSYPGCRSCGRSSRACDSLALAWTVDRRKRGDDSRGAGVSEADPARAAADVSFSAGVQRILHPGGEETRPVLWLREGCVANLPLQSLRRQW